MREDLSRNTPTASAAAIRTVGSLSAKRAINIGTACASPILARAGATRARTVKYSPRAASSNAGTALGWRISPRISATNCRVAGCAEARICVRRGIPVVPSLTSNCAAIVRRLASLPASASTSPSTAAGPRRRISFAACARLAGSLSCAIHFFESSFFPVSQSMSLFYSASRGRLSKILRMSNSHQTGMELGYNLVPNDERQTAGADPALFCLYLAIIFWSRNLGVKFKICQQSRLMDTNSVFTLPTFKSLLMRILFRG
jgi:hypothetical protein